MTRLILMSRLFLLFGLATLQGSLGCAGPSAVRSEAARDLTPAETRALGEIVVPCAVSSVRFDGSAAGTLRPQDCSVARGLALLDRATSGVSPEARVAVHGVYVPADAVLQVDLTSDAIDAYLVVFDKDGRILGQSDGGGTNARVTLPSRAGDLVGLAVMSRHVGEGGSYRVLLTSTPQAVVDTELARAREREARARERAAPRGHSEPSLALKIVGGVLGAAVLITVLAIEAARER